MLEQILHYDTELYLFLNNLGSSPWDPFWLFITHKWSALPFYALLLYLIFKNYSLKETGITLVIIVLLITATDQLANIFKHGFERSRPCGEPGVMEYARFVAVRCGRFGYFSAHASNSVGVAVFIGLILKKFHPKLLYFLLAWAVVVSYSRIYVGVHYPLDVVTGMFIGGLLGYLFYLLHKFLINNYKSFFRRYIKVPG